MTTPYPADPSEALTKRYDIEARAYLAYWAPVVHPTACRLVEAYTPEAAQRILDVGAGVGLLLPVLQKKFPEALVVGADRSEGMLNTAVTRTPLVVTDALAASFVDATFDAVVMSLVLFHLPDAIAGLREARRVLRRDGALCVSTWAQDIDSNATRIWNEELEASGAIAADAMPRLANHGLMDTPDKVKGLLDAAGFTSVRVVVEDFSHEMQIEDFIALRTGVGSSRQRFDMLPESARAQCLSRARARMAKLSADEFTLRMEIILASATSP
jgi:ubiquinone/menaquinone biosynthesis C-methylase UbiE